MHKAYWAHRLPSDVITLIHEHGDSRITADSREFYEAPGPYVGIGMIDVNLPIAFTGSALSEPLRGIVVVHHNYRRLGIGLIIVRDMLNLLESSGVVFSAQIAEDNTASIRLAAKLGLIPVSSRVLTRRDGDFKQLTLKKETS